MDATLRPGVPMRLTFAGIEGSHPCMIMGHDMQTISVTLPANNAFLVLSLNPGLAVEGTIESGSTLIAFTSKVVQAVAGNMPYCHIGSWTSAWEVRKRESLRLPVSLDMDFQHISTSANNTIPMSNINSEIGAIRPGKLVDLSLGGCCLETPSSSIFRVGDMIRYSCSLVESSPPATLLGSVVKVDGIDPAENRGSSQRLHIQFLIIDDVSQRLLFHALKQLQDYSERKEWLQAQQLVQRMRHNNVPPIGSPSRTGGGTSKIIAKSKSKSETTRGLKPVPAGAKTKSSTRSLPKIPPR